MQNEIIESKRQQAIKYLMDAGVHPDAIESISGSFSNQIDHGSPGENFKFGEALRILTEIVQTEGVNGFDRLIGGEVKGKRTDCGVLAEHVPERVSRFLIKDEAAKMLPRDQFPEHYKTELNTTSARKVVTFKDHPDLYEERVAPQRIKVEVIE